MNMLLLENARKMWENIEILNLPQEKEPNYHNTKFFTEKLLAVKMEKTEMIINKPVYLGLLIL